MLLFYPIKYPLLLLDHYSPLLLLLSLISCISCFLLPFLLIAILLLLFLLVHLHCDSLLTPCLTLLREISKAECN